MSFNKYYQEEMVALRELGKEFSDRNPALAPFLDTPGRDPDVERLLEGFSFLTGRLRQKLDDELPEITHALFHLLWPNYLRPFPSCSVVQCKPSDNLSQHTRIPKGAKVESDPVDGTACTFQTAYATDVYPVELQELSFLTRNGETILALRFSAKGPLENLNLQSLRFFLTGEKGIALTLYHMFCRKVREVRLIHTDQAQKEHRLAHLPPAAIRPLGFEEDEALFPYPPNAFVGYRILQEYFCFPEKFHFVEVKELDQGFNKNSLNGLQNPDNFSLHFVLDDLPEQFESMRKENILLSCTPVVNLFPKHATPLTLDYKQTEYRIVPDPRLPYHFLTYSVEKVESWGHSGKGEREYRPFESFEHVAVPGESPAYYRIRLKPAAKDESVETYLSIVHSQHISKSAEAETISLELLCTNRMLPLQLGVGDIRHAADGSPETVTFNNIIAVTPPYMPPLEGDILWRLLSNMSLNYIPLTDLPALRGVLSTYDFRAMHDSRRARVLQQTLNGMIAVSTIETDRIYRGLPLRGSRTTLVLNQKHFACEGEMFLFSSVLNEFLALYATVNSFHQLTVIEEKTGEEYQWPARLGTTVL